MIDKLQELLGKDRVLTGDEDLSRYSADLSEEAPCAPSAVVFPRTASEVQALVRLSSVLRLPVVPRLSGLNLAGLTIGRPGAVVMDFSGMNRVLEVSTRNMFAILEPGVTQAQLQEQIERHQMPFVFGRTLAPPSASILGSCLLGGASSVSLRHGSMSDQIAGLEFVRPDGSIGRTGAWALSPCPFGRSALPDLTGLFAGWLGTSGIIVRYALHLWPAPACRKLLLVLAHESQGVFELVARVSRLECVADIHVSSWPLPKIALGLARPKPAPLPGEPLFQALLDVSAASEADAEAHSDLVLRTVADLAAAGYGYEDVLDAEAVMKLNPLTEALLRPTVELPFLTNQQGGGLTWIALQGPLPLAHELAETCGAIHAKYGFPPCLMARPVSSGHFIDMRMLTPFDKGDPADVERASAANKEMLEAGLRMGFTPVSPPAWAMESLLGRVNPATLRLLRDLHAYLDPLGLLNPGKLPL